MPKQYDFVDRLSGGELKRLYVYGFDSESELLILDEPTNDLIL
jgi:ATP-binding cassette subfamily F protein uup